MSAKEKVIKEIAEDMDFFNGGPLRKIIEDVLSQYTEEQLIDHQRKAQEFADSITGKLED